MNKALFKVSTAVITSFPKKQEHELNKHQFKKRLLNSSYTIESLEEKLDKANIYINELEEKSKLLEHDLSKTKSQSNNLKMNLDKLICREFVYENL